MKQIINKILTAAILVSAFASCSKPAEVTPDYNAGPTVVKLLDGGAAPKVIALDYSTDLQKILVLDVRRDANNEANLNQPVVITMSNTQAYLDAYNTEHETEFELLPVDAYTIEANPHLSVAGDTWTVSFAPGEFATEIKVVVDATKFDLSKSYAFGVDIENTTLGNISGDFGESLVNVLIKNEYHGSYHSTGYFTHPTPTSSRAIDEDKELITSGLTSVKAPLADLGGSGYYMNLTVNPDNSVTITPAGVTPNIDQHWGENYYDPETKSFHLHYSYNTLAPRIIEEVITKK